MHMHGSHIQHVCPLTWFTAENITGAALCSLDKSDLKELGIGSMGKRLEVFEKIKQLTSMAGEKYPSKTAG